MSKESTTLEKCISQLESAFRSDIKDIASYLFSHGFIADELYRDVFNPSSTCSNPDRAYKLVLQVTRRVQEEPCSYYRLINYLRQDKKKYCDIVDALDAAYFGVSELQTFSAPDRQRALECEVLYKELSVIKEKWYRIGEGLKICSEILDQLVGLADPLLEVIVHWLKGEKETLPSWDAVVETLRGPVISEVELADKINRFYCDHSQEERELEERKTEADSDITSELLKVPLKGRGRLHLSHNELTKKTDEIKTQFMHFTSQLLQHLLVLKEKGTLDVSTIKSHLMVYNSKLKSPLSQCKSLQDVFEAVSSPDHSSFLDYELIKLLTDYGDDDMKDSFICYKRNLQTYLENCIIEHSTLEGEKLYAVVIDESIIKEFSNLVQLENRVKMVLGHKNIVLLPINKLNLGPTSSAENAEEEVLNDDKLSDKTTHNPPQSTDFGASSVAETTLQHQPGESNSSHESCNPQGEDCERGNSTTTASEASSSSNPNDTSLSESDQNHQEGYNIQAFFTDNLNDDYLNMADSAKQLPSKSELHTAAHEGDLPRIIELMESGHNPLDKDERGNTTLNYAAIRGHLHILKYFIDELGFNPMTTGHSGHTLLHNAAIFGHLHVLQYLLHEKDVDAFCNDDMKTTPLHFACSFGFGEIVTELVESMSKYLPGQDCNSLCADVSDITPLHLAASNGHLSIVKYLALDKQCDPIIKTQDGNLPLHMAALNGQLNVVKLLLSGHFPSDPMARDGNGHTAFHIATKKGHLNILRYFIEARECNPALPAKDGTTCLHIAAHNGHLHVVEYLTSIQSYESFHFDQYKISPLHLAASHGHLPIVKFLITEKKVDSMSKDLFSHTPFHLAAEGGHIDVVEFLISISNLHLKAANILGHNALHEAAIAGNLSLVKYYIEKHNCNPSSLDKVKKSPLSLAAKHGHLSVVKYLTVDQKCDPLAADANGNNAFHHAAQRGQLKVLQFLFSYANCTPEMVNRNGFNALYLAALKGHVPVMRFLVFDRKYDPLCEDTNKLTPFHAAASKGYIDVVRFYIAELNCSSQNLDVYGQNVLHSAAIGGALEVAKYLIEEEEFDPSSLNSSKQTPLFVASIYEGNLALIKYLTLEMKCNPLQKDRHGMTPFTAAARKGLALYVQFFLSILDDTTRVTNRSGGNALHMAAMAGNLSIVRLLVEDGSYDPNSSDSTQSTPLFYAAAYGHFSIVKYLLQDPRCDPSTQNADGATPLVAAAEKGHFDIVVLLSAVSSLQVKALHAAAINGHFRIVQYLVEQQGYDPSLLGLRRSTPLHYAASNGHYSIVKYLVEHCNCDPHCKNDDGDTPLHLAASRSREEIVKFLSDPDFENPAMPDKEMVGPNALHKAAHKGHIGVVKYLIEERDYTPSGLDLATMNGHLAIVKYLINTCKCDATVRSPNSLLTLLHYAAYYGHLDIVQFYIEELQWDPHIKDGTNSAPVHYAAFNGHLETVEYLMTDPSPPLELLLNDARHYPIHHASFGGHVEVVEYFEHLFDIHAVDIDGWTCLHMAALKGQLEAVEYFIEQRSFDPAVEDFSKVTPLHLAAWKGELDVVSYLVFYKGCNPLCQDRALDTPLHWAASEGQLEVVQLFAEAGCSLQVEGENKSTPLDYAIFYGHENVVQFLCGVLFQ